MLFVTAGMGGGTGTGAAPVIAELAKEMGILTVGIVTLPFQWEGRRRSLQALAGVDEMKTHVDSLLVINNDKLRIQFGNLSVREAFAKADNVLTIAAKGIAEIITATGKVNTDFEDVKTVIKDSGKAIMGQAVAEGENRAMRAIEEAMNSPLLNDNDINGATNILLHIVSGSDDITMDEISEITEYVQEESGHEADVIWGLGEDESLGSNIGITVIATGFDSPRNTIVEQHKPKTTHSLYSSKPRVEEKPKVEEKLNVEEKPVVEETEIKPIIEGPTMVNPSFKREADNKFISDIETKINKEVKDVKPEAEEESEIHLINKPINNPTNEPKAGHENSEDRRRIVHTLGDDSTIAEKEVTEEKETFTLIKRTDIKEETKVTDNTTYDIRPQADTVIEEEVDIKKNADERVSKLKMMSMSFRKPGKINELENQPAYMRKNVELKDPEYSSQSIVSRHTLGEDSKNNTVIKSDNSFLHDNVD